MKLKGVYPIVPTPFDETGRICRASIEALAEFLVQKGVDGVAVLGVMGEGQKLDELEKKQVIELFRQALPANIQLVAGVRAAGTELARRAAAEAVYLGADAILLGPPPVQSDEAIFSYCKQVASTINVPIILHDYPAATNILLSVELTSRMFREIEKVQYLKLEDPPTGPKMDKLRRLIGEDLAVFSALGGMYIFEELDRGAVGIMTGFAYPELLVKIYQLYCQGDIDQAMTVFYDILPLIRFEFQPGLGISLRKHILNRRGIFRSTALRHPGLEADAKTLEHLDRILHHLKKRGYDL